MVATINADSFCFYICRHESYTSFGDSMLIAFYLAVMIFRICCLAADSGRKVECEHESYTLSAVYDVRGVTSIGLHESYTSFGDSMLTAFYLAVMIFRIWCLAADSGRMIPSGRVNGQVTPGNLKATSTRLTKRERIDVADHTQRMYGL
ncbi:hypothetical protein Tco_0827558 [Tanacetum coccineum]